MIEVTSRRMTAIMRAYHALLETGRTEDAEELIASFREPEPVASTPSPTPEAPKPRRVRTPEEREADRIRKLIERAEKRSLNGAVRHASDSASDTSDMADDGGRFVGRLSDASRDHACLPEREEKRKPLLSGQFSANSESSEKCESSQLRARPTTCPTADDGGRNGGRMADAPSDRTAALRVLNRLQMALGSTWDFHSWRSELERISTKPDAELEKVLAHMKADVWVKDNLGIAHPGHVLKHWGKYLQPPKGKRAAPVDETPVTNRYVNHAADAQMRRDLYGVAGGKR